MISRAKRNGWKAEVEALRAIDGQPPFCVMVTLSRRFEKGMLWVWANVYVSFRASSKYSRASVTISSQCDFQKESSEGIWSAKHAIAYVEDTISRHS